MTKDETYITVYHVTSISNLESILKQGLIPQIGMLSAGVEIKERIYLFPTYEDCETALGQWLGAVYDELIPDEEVVSLKIKLPHNFPLVRTCEWEYATETPIPPQYITFYKNEG